MPHKNDIRLGQLLIRKQWCSFREVSDALSQQNSVQRGERLALGRILLDRDVVTRDQLMVALAELGVLVLECGSCGSRYSLGEYSENQAYPCHDCSEPLRLSDAPPHGEDIVAYDSSVVVSGPNPGASAETPDSGIPVAGDPFLGRVFGGCKLVEKIAAGGMGVVYKAQQLNLNRVVAVKLLSRELASDESFVRRFVEEARSAAQLNHANIVSIIDVGDYQDVFYFTMEYVDGVNLKSLLSEGERLSVPKVLEVAIQVCSALAHAHDR
ncbi:MAG: protein kinase, partial [Planctomycetota bacterium]